MNNTSLFVMILLAGLYLLPPSTFLGDQGSQIRTPSLEAIVIAQRKEIDLLKKRVDYMNHRLDKDLTHSKKGKWVEVSEAKGYTCPSGWVMVGIEHHKIRGEVKNYIGRVFIVPLKTAK